MAGVRTSGKRSSGGRRRGSVRHWLDFIIVTALLLVCLSWSGAVAQDDAPWADEVTFEEIVVTGSRIARRDFTTPTPLSTLDSEDLAFSGQVTLEEALNQMPQVMPRPGRGATNADRRNRVRRISVFPPSTLRPRS